jgi:hypothetical protein
MDSFIASWAVDFNFLKILTIKWCFCFIAVWICYCGSTVRISKLRRKNCALDSSENNNDLQWKTQNSHLLDAG